MLISGVRVLSNTLLVITLILLSSHSLAKKGGFGGLSKAEPTPCPECENLEGFLPADEIDDEIRRMVGKYRRGAAKNVAIQKARGVIETYLKTDFIGGANCPEIDSEQWAIDYSHKRPRAALHKGIDIPQPRGTPIRAIADGMVVANFLNSGNRKGIEIMLRHTPEDTGLEFWTYSQYTHLEALSDLAVGARVNMGDVIGSTSNTGKMGRRIRRDALHFAVLYADNPFWSHDGYVVAPKDSYFMDPVAFYRPEGPYDSVSMLNLPGQEKLIKIPYLSEDGSLYPAHTKRIWPYVCN